MLLIDIVIIILSLACTGIMFRFWQKVNGNGRMVLTLGFAYASVIRALVIARDITGANIPTAQLTLVFWVMMVIGLAMLLREIKHTLRSNRS